MDKKTTVVWMVFFLVLIVLWGPISNVILTQLGYDPRPATQKSSTVVSNTPAGPTTIPTLSAPSVGSATTQAVTATTQTATGEMNPGAWAAISSTNPQQQSLGSEALKDPTWAIGVTVSPNGAGLDRAVINNYKLLQKSNEPFIFERPGYIPELAERTRTLAVRDVVVDGTIIPITGAAWTFVGVSNTPDSQTATYELTLSRHGTPALTLQRTYTVYSRAYVAAKVEANTFEPLGYEARVVTGFRNLTASPMKVQLRFNGQSVPPTEAERGPDSYYLIGRAEDGIVNVTNWAVDSIKDTSTDLLEKAKERKGQPYWVGAATTYFMSMVRFEPQQGATVPMDWIESVEAKALTPTDYGNKRLVELLITTKPTEVAANAESQIAARVYLGPKKREILSNTHYLSPWIQYQRTLVITQGICAICTWQWLIDILFFILKSFHYVTRDWGLAIIGLVILVRILLHPISKKAQLNMLKFGKLAPEMERIKKKYADDQETMQKEMMRFYRENGTTQIMGCLPMFLQMPVWIALWQAMQTTFELRHEPFFYNLTWIKDLSKPDHLIDFGQAYHLPLLSFVVISGVNVLPFVFGALQFLQFKIQPKPPSMTPEQAQQQKMTQWMILIMMPVLLYASPSGLMIYMITSFLIGILETKIVKKQFEAMSAEEDRFKLVEGDVVPAGASSGSVQKATVRRAGAKEPKKGGLMGMIEQIREKAIEAQREMEKNRKKPK